MRENFLTDPVNTENKTKKKGKDKWKRIDKRKQNLFLKGKIPYFFLFTFYDWLRKGQKNITQLCLKIQLSTSHCQINATCD